MKVKFTFLKLLVVFLLSAQMIVAQNVGDYQTTGASTLWNNTATWARWDGVSWVTPATAPVTTDGVITILNGHTVQVNVPVTADELVVATGGTLNIDVAGNNLTLNDGAGTDLTINGTLLLRGNNTLGGTGTPNIVLNGTMNWFSGILAVNTVGSAGSFFNLNQFDFVKRLSANLVNNGTFNWSVSTAAIEFFNGNLTNNGTFNATSLSSGLAFTNLGGTNSITNTGTFNKTTNHPLANNAIAFTNSGTLKGLGTYNLTGTVTNTGVISPGTIAGPSAALLSVVPALVTANTPDLYIEILNNSGPGTGHDRIDFTATVDVSGVDLIVVENSATATGTYTILTTPIGTSFSGNFASVLIPQGYTLNYTPGVGNTVSVTKNLATLPVAWGSFTALANNSKVNLAWSTLQEINTSHFVVEYSIDGINFSPLATVAAAGNSSTVREYSFVHSSPTLNRNNFYRIQQVDIDSRKSTSAIRTVKFSNGNVVALLATPNPVRDVLQLTVQASGITVRLVDLNGRPVKTMNLQPGVQPMNVQDLSTGIYQLVIYQDNKQIGSQRIVKQ